MEDSVFVSARIFQDRECTIHAIWGQPFLAGLVQVPLSGYMFPKFLAHHVRHSEMFERGPPNRCAVTRRRLTAYRCA